MASNRLNYHFSDETSQPDIQSSHYQRYALDKGINTSRVAHFAVEAHEDSFIDLSKSFIKTVFNVRKANGDPLPDTDPKVFLTAHYGSNLWSQVAIYLNNTQLAPCSEYPYTSLVIDILGTSADFRGYVTTPLSGWAESSMGSSSIASQFEIDPLAYMENKALVTKSKPVTVYDRIHSDFLMTCSQLLPNKMPLVIALTRGKDSFVLGRDPKTADEYVINIISVSLFVKRVTLNPAARAIVNNNLSMGGKLHYQRLNTVAFPCPKDSKTWTWLNCFNNTVPRRVFVALVTQDSYFGSWDRSSTYLESAGVSQVRICQDGREIMAEPYTCNFSYKKPGVVNSQLSEAKSAYAGLVRVLNSFASPRNHVGPVYDGFLDGFTLFAVDLEHADSLATVSGSLDIHIEFASLTSNPLMVLVTGEFPKTLGFDANRQIKEM